jgi:Ca2+-binding EF-hand superfamily protein
MIRLFELRPLVRPILPPMPATGGIHKIALSEAQSSQIREIFELFDTDGGGNIDRSELDLAMVALGFQKKQRSRATPAKPRPSVMSSGMLDSIVKDGSVTVEEFTALMTGELSGRDPVETLRAVFAVLSGVGGEGAVEGSVITLDSLAEACNMYEVCPGADPSSLGEGSSETASSV